MESSRARSAGRSLLRPSVREESVSERETSDLSSTGDFSRRAVGVDFIGSLEQAGERHRRRSVGPAHRYGTSLSDLYDHSWR